MSRTARALSKSSTSARAAAGTCSARRWVVLSPPSTESPRPSRPLARLCRHETRLLLGLVLGADAVARGERQRSACVFFTRAATRGERPALGESRGPPPADAAEPGATERESCDALLPLLALVVVVPPRRGRLVEGEAEREGACRGAVTTSSERASGSVRVGACECADGAYRADRVAARGGGGGEGGGEEGGASWRRRVEEGGRVRNGSA